MTSFALGAQTVPWWDMEGWTAANIPGCGGMAQARRIAALETILLPWSIDEDDFVLERDSFTIPARFNPGEYTNQDAITKLT